MSPLDKFGKFLVSSMRDRGIDHYNLLETHSLKALALRQLQDDLSELNPKQKDIVRRCVVRILDTSMHDLLAAFQEAHDLDEGIDLLVDNENIAEVSGMLHGEIFGDRGWIEKFSKYPKCNDIPQ